MLQNIIQYDACFVELQKQQSLGKVQQLAETKPTQHKPLVIEWLYHVFYIDNNRNDGKAKQNKCFVSCNMLGKKRVGQTVGIYFYFKEIFYNLSETKTNSHNFERALHFTSFKHVNTNFNFAPILTQNYILFCHFFLVFLNCPGNMN